MVDSYQINLRLDNTVLRRAHAESSIGFTVCNREDFGGLRIGPERKEKIEN